jgi:hypothetical protein
MTAEQTPTTAIPESRESTEQEAPEAPPEAAEGIHTEQEAPEAPPEDAETEQDTFPRSYVEKLRQEAAEARVKAKKAADLAREVFTLRVAATGRLADPSDLPYDESLFNDPSKLDAAIDELLQAHPHYAARTPRGDIGQGAGKSDAGSVDLAAILRAGAR